MAAIDPTAAFAKIQEDAQRFQLLATTTNQNLTNINTAGDMARKETDKEGADAREIGRTVKDSTRN
jgi:hypothetical protein